MLNPNKTFTSEGCCEAQQIQDQALPEVLDQRILRLRPSLQLHPQGAGEPEGREPQRQLGARRQERLHAARHVQVSFIIPLILKCYELVFRTAAQVFGLASMRKASLEAGDSSGSDDGRQSLRGGHFDIHQYVRPREDLALGLEKFPTFYPRNLQGGTDYSPMMGPVGSGRPDRIRHYPGA